jgi:adenosylcobinamide kinase/adenosylcobinamide-phosphate guanylyltransferase
MGRLTLVLGGIRSGKSAWGEQLAAAEGPRVLYVATAEACDAEMRDRIQLHRERRPASWTTVEGQLDPAGAMRAAAGAWDAVLIDSLSAWIANLMLAGDRPQAATPAGDGMLNDSAILTKADGLLSWFREAEMPAVVISDEVGMSLVATTSVGRRFQDLIGLVNQRAASAADDVYLLTAGLPLQLKSSPPRRAAFSGDPFETPTHDSDRG